MTHEQFGMKPQLPEIQRDILQKELDSVEENLEMVIYAVEKSLDTYKFELLHNMQLLAIWRPLSHRAACAWGGH